MATVEQHICRVGQYQSGTCAISDSDRSRNPTKCKLGFVIHLICQSHDMIFFFRRSSYLALCAEQSPPSRISGRMRGVLFKGELFPSVPELDMPSPSTHTSEALFQLARSLFRPFRFMFLYVWHVRHYLNYRGLHVTVCSNETRKKVIYKQMTKLQR